MANTSIESVIKEPLWKIRLKLWMRSFRQNWELFKEKKIALFGLGVIIFFAIFGALYPLYPVVMKNLFWKNDMDLYDMYTPYDPIIGFDATIYSHPSPPSLKHPLGTDPLGRDVLSQLMYSTPREFVLGITAALITVIIGTIIGAASAYFGGLVDTFFMRLADIVMLFPLLALLMVLSAFIELTLFKLALIIGLISGFGSITIVLKSQALTVKVRPFIEAAKSAGASDGYIIFKHIIPNILPLSFLYMMFSVTNAIFSEAVLSFLGLVNIRMSWGIIIHTAQANGYLIGSFIAKYWWLWAPPGVSITLLCSAFYFLGRGLEEIINPRLRKR